MQYKLSTINLVTISNITILFLYQYTFCLYYKCLVAILLNKTNVNLRFYDEHSKTVFSCECACIIYYTVHQNSSKIRACLSNKLLQHIFRLYESESSAHHGLTPFVLKISINSMRLSSHLHLYTWVDCSLFVVCSENLMNVKLTFYDFICKNRLSSCVVNTLFTRFRHYFNKAENIIQPLLFDVTSLFFIFKHNFELRKNVRNY